MKWSLNTWMTVIDIKQQVSSGPTPTWKILPFILVPFRKNDPSNSSSIKGKCQVSFNMKERVYSAYTERKNRARKEEKKKEGRRRMRENRRDLM
jgi:hypothetical protein